MLIDELAFLTAYQPDRDLRKRAEAAIATLTSQGRSVGVCVVGALQDPRKDVISLRNLFPTRIALRLDESDQVDMVLGDGARDRGALADEISPLPETGAGVGYVRLEGSPEVVRVRAAYVTDDDIRAMAEWRPVVTSSARTVSHGRSDRADRVAHRRAVPRLRGRAVPDRPRRTGAGRRVPAVRLVRTLGPPPTTSNGRRGWCPVTNAGGRKGTRAERLSMPLARDVVKDLAVEHGACIRPVQLRRTDLSTGETEPVLVPVRAHPRQRLPVVRRTGQEPPRRAMPGGLAPRPRTGHRTRRPHRRADVAGSRRAPTPR